MNVGNGFDIIKSRRHVNVGGFILYVICTISNVLIKSAVFVGNILKDFEIATLQHCNFAQLFGRVNGIWEGDIYIRISLREDIYINIYRYLYKYLLLTPLPLSH